MGEVFFTSGLVIVALMAATWIVSGLLRDASVVDLVWGLGFVLVAWAVYFRHAPQPDPTSPHASDWASDRGRSLLTVALTSLWGLRLSAYLAWRNLGKGEDFRYRSMREKRGERFFLVSLGTVFGLQGLIMWVVSLPVQAAVASPGAADVLGMFTIAGVSLWVIGIFFEVTGDIQLARFKSNPANESNVMDRGLWRYTRHPNYFGDFCVWWGLYLIAFEAGHWWSIVGPALMTVLLMKYSGTGLLEKTIVDRRPDYRDYIRRTSAFFPMAPRS